MNPVLAFFLLFVTGIVALVFLWPIILAGAFFYILVVAVLGAVYFVVLIVGFIYYLGRRQPDLGKKEFSIDQGKEVK